jgi:hypothetical protein
LDEGGLVPCAGIEGDEVLGTAHAMTYEERPRALVSVLSWATVSVSHERLRRTVEARERRRSGAVAVRDSLVSIGRE